MRAPCVREWVSAAGRQRGRRCEAPTRPSRSVPPRWTRGGRGHERPRWRGRFHVSLLAGRNVLPVEVHVVDVPPPRPSRSPSTPRRGRAATARSSVDVGSQNRGVVPPPRAVGRVTLAPHDHLGSGPHRRGGTTGRWRVGAWRHLRPGVGREIVASAGIEEFAFGYPEPAPHDHLGSRPDGRRNLAVDAESRHCRPGVRNARDCWREIGHGERPVRDGRRRRRLLRAGGPPGRERHLVRASLPRVPGPEQPIRERRAGEALRDQEWIVVQRGEHLLEQGRILTASGHPLQLRAEIARRDRALTEVLQGLGLLQGVLDPTAQHALGQHLGERWFRTHVRGGPDAMSPAHSILLGLTIFESDHARAGRDPSTQGTDETTERGRAGARSREKLSLRFLAVPRQHRLLLFLPWVYVGRLSVSTWKPDGVLRTRWRGSRGLRRVGSGQLLLDALPDQEDEPRSFVLGLQELATRVLGPRGNVRERAAIRGHDPGSGRPSRAALPGFDRHRTTGPTRRQPVFLDSPPSCPLRWTASLPRRSWKERRSPANSTPTNSSFP